MSRARSFGILTCSLAVIVALTGCSDGKDMQINMLQDKLRDAEQRNYDLETRLAAAMSDADEARSWAAQLQQELADARSQPTPETAVPEGWMHEGGLIWKDIADDILFDSGKAKLKATARATLEGVARVIQQELAGRDIWIVGHTDSDPIIHSPYKDNLQLSLERARTVALELYTLGVEPKHVIAGGQGEFNPLPGATKAQNRRVQIIAVQRRHDEASGAASPTASEPLEPVETIEQTPPEK